MDLLLWFSGGDRQYHTLWHCMRGDTFWVVLSVVLDVIVACGYLVIARHWGRQEQQLPDGAPKTALHSLKNIFVFCGLCGYLFVPVKLFWPAWRLYDLFMAGLAYFTWRYAWSSRGLTVVYRELNRAQELEEELQASRAEARRKAFFLNAISHDLRTPLNGLSLQVDLAQLSLERGDLTTVREALAQIRSSTRCTADLLTNFLELGRVEWNDESNALTEFDLRTVLDEVSSSLRGVAQQKGLSLRVQPGPPIYVRTDRAKLQRILLNLVNNGIKFTPTGTVEMTVEQNGNLAAIHARDTGVGLAAEELAHLFEEFYQVSNRERDRNKGFGLGLAIAKRLADQLGARIIVRSIKGTGSCFTPRLENVSIMGIDSHELTRGFVHQAGQAAAVGR